MTAATDPAPITAIVDRDFSISPSTQLRALAGRMLQSMVRQGQLVVAFMQPVVFFVCFYVPLHKSLETPGVPYAQYLLPVIVVFAMFFVSMFSADMAAREVVGGMATRLRSMPVPPWVPVSARATANLARAVAALLGALVIGTVFGFRFHSLPGAVVFLLLALVFGIGLMIATDALGTVTGNPQLGGTVLFVPQLLLLMTSTGFVRAEGFPGWIQPWVRNQPISQLAAALRGLADDRYVPEVGVSIAWIVGIFVVGAIAAVRAEGRRA